MHFHGKVSKDNVLVQGIATMVLESPFYGARKPEYQFASQLLRVSDLLTLGHSGIDASAYNSPVSISSIS